MTTKKKDPKSVMPSILPVGAHVKVRIAHPSEYARNAADCLEGSIGVVTSYSARSGDYLITFDRPAPSWFTHQGPCKAFHFPPRDLVLLDPS